MTLLLGATRFPVLHDCEETVTLIVMANTIYPT